MQILARIRSGEDVSHIENSAISSYMVNAGYGIDEVVDVFKERSDFDEKIARYQDEDIWIMHRGWEALPEEHQEPAKLSVT